MKTLALVIGNNDYYDDAKLVNAVNDAASMSEVFARLGFDVISGYNCAAIQYAELLLEFESKVPEYDATLFYFAGHGFEMDGENYLAGIDCQISNSNKYHFGQTSIRLSEILEIFNKYSGKINIVIIDACRKSFDRSNTVGFSPIQAPKGTLLAFSTSPNEGASDKGFEGHSIYTGSILKYIGRERLSVEELFKKVRKTVYNLSEERQTTWEHTSLIGDYYFNTGQLVYSLSIPYDENVVKDNNYNSTSPFGILIRDLKSYDWYIQNPAIDKLLKIPASKLDKNEQFVLGRNLLQSSGAANNAISFMDNIESNISKYNVGDDNHTLNGILFEIYFDSFGEFRENKTKKHNFDKIIALRKRPQFSKSFDFIRELLINTGYPLIYLPKLEDDFFDIDIVAANENIKVSNKDVRYDIISKITCNGIDIIDSISKYEITGLNEKGLINALADFLSAPTELIQLNCNIELKRISILSSKSEEAVEF